MLNGAELLAQLDRVIGETATVDLPRLIGDLERVKTQALLRMTAPAASVAPSQPPDENLSAKEAARRLGVSRDFLYKATKARRLPFAIRIGRRVVFDPRGLDRWKRQRMIKTV
jgi:excisionase family DNA binding protein